MTIAPAACLAAVHGVRRRRLSKYSGGFRKAVEQRQGVVDLRAVARLVVRATSSSSIECPNR